MDMEKLTESQKKLFIEDPIFNRCISMARYNNFSTESLIDAIEQLCLMNINLQKELNK